MDAPPPPHLNYPHVLHSSLKAIQGSASEIVANAAAAAEAGLFCESEQLFILALTLEDAAQTREMCAQVAMENDCACAAVVHAARAAATQPTWPAAHVTLGRACRNAGVRASAHFVLIFFFWKHPSLHLSISFPAHSHCSRFAGELGRASAAFTTALSLLSSNDVSRRTVAAFHLHHQSITLVAQVQAAEVELEQREVLQLLQQLQEKSRGGDLN